MAKHPETTGRRVTMIAGVKYVPTPIVVVDRFDDGEPRLVRVVRPDAEQSPADFRMVWAPASWSRGP